MNTRWWSVIRFTGIGSLVLISVGLALAITAAQHPPRAASRGQVQQASACDFPFQAILSSGPDAGMGYQGDMHLSIDETGDANGTLTLADGSTVAVVGQATGRSLTVLLHLGPGLGYMSGIGTADSDIRACAFHSILGPLAGPSVDDLGAWSETNCCDGPGHSPLGRTR